MSFLQKSSSPLFPSIKGLSSPFRDQPLASLSTPFHIIDISPSPPPSAIQTHSGRFEDALSPEPMSPGNAVLKLSSANRNPQPKLLPNLKPVHQPIGLGLGLGIDTGEGSLENFLSATQEPQTTTHAPFTQEVKPGNMATWFPNRLSHRKPKSNPLRSGFGGFRAGRAWKDHGYLAEDEGDDERRGGEDLEDLDDKHADAPKETAMVGEDVDFFHGITRHRKTQVLPMVPRKGAWESTGAQLVSTRGARRIVSSKDPAHDKILEVVPQVQNILKSRRSIFLSSARKSPERSVPIIIAPRSDSHLINRLMRFRMNARATDDFDHTLTTSPVNPPAPFDNMNAVTTSDPPLIFGVPNSSGTPTIINSAASPALFSRSDTPLLLSSSPALPAHSPSLHGAPGSFSPWIQDNAAFSPSMTPTPVPESAPTHSGAGSFVFSMLLGSLGVFGLFFIVIALIWKKNGGCPGLTAWRRKPRGNAYDEFMEEEESWWVAEKKLTMYREKSLPNMCFVPEIQSRIRTVSTAEKDHAQISPVRRSPSEAPSLPPLAHDVGGDIGLDSLAIGNPLPSAPSMTSVFSDSSDEDDQPAGNKSNVNRKNFEKPAHPNSIKVSDPTIRTRSESKSSMLSKASLKSMGSLASLFLIMAKFEGLGGANKKAKSEMGISSEDYKTGSPLATEINNDDQSPSKSPKKTAHASFSSSVKKVGAVGGLTRPASVHLDKLVYSLDEPPKVSKRPKTMSFIPPAILITDHPSALIPPSPPHMPPFEERPISVGTILTQYSIASYQSEQPHPKSDLPSSHFSISSFATRSALESIRSYIPRSQESSSSLESLSVGKMGVRGDYFPGRQRVAHVSPTFPDDKGLVKEAPRITSLSNLLSYRGRMSGGFSSAGISQPLKAPPKYASLQKSSLSTVTSSKTIIELAAVTEDLRALVDSEAEGDCSWESPSRFHQSVPDRVPVNVVSHMVPPMRPPKSMNRYTLGKPLSIEFESTSTPSSPINPNSLSQGPKTSTGRVVLMNSARRSGITQASSAQVDFPPTRSTNPTDPKASTFKAPKSHSGSSLATVISDGSNTSSFEEGSLHTAQTIRGASVEYVARGPLAESFESPSWLMRQIAEEN